MGFSTIARLVSALVLLILLASCGSRESRSDHLVLVVFDTLRAMLLQEARLLAWLDSTVDRGEPPAEGSGDSRFLWSAIGLVSFLILLWRLVPAIAARAPRVESSEVSPVRGLGLLMAALGASALLLLGVDSSGSSGPFGFIPFVAGRDLVGYLAIAGVLMWISLRPSSAGLGLDTCLFGAESS